MDEMLSKLCDLGNEANKLFASGFHKEAEKKYLQIVSQIRNSKSMDSYLVSKSVLGLLLTAIKSQNFERAISIWVNHSAESIFSVGISGLENAQTSVHDMLVYDFICAYLHSISVNKAQSSAKAVNLYMSRVCEHALELKDKKIMRLALSNWKQHLREVFNQSIPHGSAVELIKYEKKFGEAVPVANIDFPKLSDWQKPDDFREMSKFINLDEQKLKKMGLELGNKGGAARKIKSR